MPRISVIIPHYQDLAGLEICLSGLERQTMSRSEFEIIVADNNSPVGAEAVRAVVRDRARLVTCMEKGAGPNRNAAVAVSTGEILAFIDSDCQPEPEWLQNGVPGLSCFDFIGGQVTVLVRDPQHKSAAEAFEAVFAFDFKTYINKKGFTGAGNMMCPRAMFDQVGGFSNKVSEDIEWSNRATAMGFRLGYVHDAIVGHPARRTWSELETKWRRLNVELFLLHLKSGKSRWTWLARCVAMPASAVAHTPKVLVAPQLSSMRERLLALTVLYRSRLWRFVHGVALPFSHRGA